MAIRDLVARRRRRSSHLVQAGLVGCPVVGGDVEVDACFACGKLKSVAEGPDGELVVVCSGRPPSSVFAPSIPTRS